MQIGRNHPCPCGSGKKYKKCCLQKDEENERLQNSIEPAKQSVDELTADLPKLPEPPAPPPDPHLEAFNARWNEFEKQDYEGQIALFLQTLEEPDLMDGEMAFEMLNTLYEKIVTHDQRGRYDELVEKLRERLPEVYSEHAHFYLQNRITNTVVAERFESIPAMMNELAQRAGRDIDVFNNVIEQLAYHGQLPALIDAMHIAWSKVNYSGEIVPWGIDEFASRAVQNLVFDYVERNPAATTGDAELFERIKFYTQIEPERINKFIAILSGQSARQWTRDDFSFKPKARDRYADTNGVKIPKEIQQNLFDMSLEFQGCWRREANVSFVKSELGREQIVTYFVERLAGALEPRQSMLDDAVNRPKPKTRPPEFYLKGDENSVPWLCPDRETLDHFLSNLFHFLNPHPYTAAAMFELIPAWLDFLESRQLITASLREQTLQNLRKLTVDLLELLPKMASDPALPATLKHCWENVEVEKSL